MTLASWRHGVVVAVKEGPRSEAVGPGQQVTPSETQKLGSRWERSEQHWRLTGTRSLGVRGN